jgi:hypothetical protein
MFLEYGAAVQTSLEHNMLQAYLGIGKKQSEQTESTYIQAGLLGTHPLGCDLLCKVSEGFPMKMSKPDIDIIHFLFSEDSAV